MLKFLLNSEKKTINKLRNVFIAYGILMVWLVIITTIYRELFAQDFEMQLFVPAYKHPNWVNIFYYLFIPPIFEEILFRKFPLDIIKSTKKYDLLLPTMLFTSTVFGLVHGDASNILIQGVGGFILACLYVKNGFSWWSSALLHFLWNFGLMYLINL